MTADIAVVGAGAAGLSAALVLGRARRRTVVLDGGPPRNAPASAAHGFLSRDGIQPLELLRVSLAQLRPYGTVEVRNGRARDARRRGDGFTLAMEDGSTLAVRGILLATGVVDGYRRSRVSPSGGAARCSTVPSATDGR